MFFSILSLNKNFLLLLPIIGTAIFLFIGEIAAGVFTSFMIIITLLSVPALSTERNYQPNMFRYITNLISPATILSSLLILLSFHYFDTISGSSLILKILFGTLISFIYVFILSSITTNKPPTFSTIFSILGSIWSPPGLYKALLSSLLFTIFFILTVFINPLLIPVLSTITIIFLGMLRLNT